MIFFVRMLVLVSPARLEVIKRARAMRGKFTRVLAGLRSPVTCRAHRDSLTRIAELNTIPARNKTAGQLSPELNQELLKFIAQKVHALAGFSDDNDSAMCPSYPAVSAPAKPAAAKQSIPVLLAENPERIYNPGLSWGKKTGNYSLMQKVCRTRITGGQNGCPAPDLSA